MSQLPVERQTFLTSNRDDLNTKHSSIFPLSKTAKGAKGMRQLPVISQTLLQSNDYNLFTKPSINFPPSKTANGAKGKEQLPVENESLPTSIGDKLATKLEGLAEPNWDPKQRDNSDGPECHGCINMRGERLILPPSDMILPTWSPALQVKGYGIANPTSNVLPSKTANGAKWK